MHEVYAGFLCHTDAQIGRLVDALERIGVLDNTLILRSSTTISADKFNARPSRDPTTRVKSPRRPVRE
jgi:hypothetical protein